jgi:ATP-dependent Clp protease adaptor protein ClpS
MLSTLADAGTATEEETRTETWTDEVPGLADPWVTIVWNDPVNLMSYVSYVFESYFGYPPAKAKKLMLQVHHEGRAVVSSGPRERMEVDVQAMHGYGLWATMQQSGQGGAGAPDAEGGQA